jgi:uncharacterized membrane protein YgcG
MLAGEFLFEKRRLSMWTKPGALLCLLLAMAVAGFAQEHPNPTGYVSDFANLLSPDQARSLNDELIAFEKKTTVEIAVVTVRSLNGQSIEDYTKGLAREWGVGTHGKNNGIVFLVALSERKIRIETASGARAILTDGRADEIRDQNVLPRFKSGNMASGIIDGTHAIMRTFDASPASAATSSTPNRSQSSTGIPPDSSHVWTAAYTKILEFYIGGLVGIGLLLFLVVPPIRRSKARTYVLENQGPLLERLTRMERTAANADVKSETRAKLTELKGEFSSISPVTAVSDKGDWVDLRKKLLSIDRSLNEITLTMTNEIAFAEKARKEGPRLMQELPGVIRATRRNLVKGKRSPEAVKYLKEARAKYAQARSQQSGMASTDWVMMYMLLSDSHSNCEMAESAQEHANAVQHPHIPSSSSTNSVSPLGFGDSGVGFGGGGGFDGGGSGGGGFDGSGGGSTGSW